MEQPRRSGDVTVRRHWQRGLRELADAAPVCRLRAEAQLLQLRRQEPEHGRVA